MNYNNHKTDKHCNTVFHMGTAGQRGRAGDRGPTGDAGSQGPQGDQGEPGEQILNMAVVYDLFSNSEPPTRLVAYNNGIYYAVLFEGNDLFESAGTGAITNPSSSVIGLASGYYLISYNLTIGAVSDEIVGEVYRFALLLGADIIPSSRQSQNISSAELNQAKSISGTCVVLSTAAIGDTTELRLVLIAPNDPNVTDNLGIYSASITIWRIEDAPSAG